MKTPLPDVENDLAVALAGAGLGLVLHQSVVPGREVSHGDGVDLACVFVVMYSGEGLALDADDVESKPRCQIIVRGEPREYGKASALARAIMNVLHMKRDMVATGIPSTQTQVYADVRCLDAVPQVLDDNENASPRLIVNVECVYVD